MPTNSGIRMILAHVSMIGMLRGMSVQLIVYACSQRTADAFHLRKFVHARGHEPFQPAETRKQALPPLGADTRDAFERRSRACLAAARTVPLDRKTVCFVAYLLNQMQR